MAVVSISRIQIRRGKEQSGSGLPQLASGELGWAIDTQRLYIGNGSVSEGAPYVGNTRIITEGENLFEVFENSYVYRDGSSIADTVSRDLQDRLDDRVSVRAFGATGDGSTDDTAALQAAIYQLYLGTSEGDQAILYIEPGIYNITGRIYVPNNTWLLGAGVDKTVIRQTGTSTSFLTVSSELSTASLPVWTSTVSSNNQPSNIIFSGLTIENTQAGNANPMIHLFNCKDSIVENVKFISAYDALAFSDIDINGNPNVTDIFGIQLSSDSADVNSNNNTVRNCMFESLFAGIYCDDYTINNTFEDNTFEKAVYGVAFGLGLETFNTSLPYPNNNVIINNNFDNIYANGIAVAYGVDNASKNNRFYNVGNRYAGHASADFATYANIKFDYAGNISVDDWFERQYILTTGSSRNGVEQLSLTGIAFAPAVQGPVAYSENYRSEVEITDTTSFSPLIRFAADSVKTYEVEYSYTSSTRNFARFGTLTITVEPSTQTVSLIDDYDIAGEDNYAENIEWSTSFPNNDTVLISTKNQGDRGNLIFTTTTKA